MEIKFKFWNKEQKCMNKSNELSKIMLYNLILPKELRESWTPLQNIGAVDTNGKEIFEGDILSLKNSHIGTVFAHPTKGGWYLDIKDTVEIPIHEGLTSSYEIIGNIYE